MDNKEEYHDPDYPESSKIVNEESPSSSNEDKTVKIKEIIRREFTNELEVRENEIMLIDQRMTASRRMLHKLRYALVTAYYEDQKLRLSAAQIDDEVAAISDVRVRSEVASALRDGQRGLHPSVRKLLGRQTVDLSEIFKSRQPRNKSRRDYSAMLQKRNYTVAASTTKSLRTDNRADSELSELSEQAEQTEQAERAEQSKPRKVPRRLCPRIENVFTLDEATRNKMKHRYRIIIGNTSKYAPPASSADRSTHKWLLYVRTADGDVNSSVLTAVTARLHASYAPHHLVTITKPPFHISRRGWGEFAAKLQLHFALPDRNPPATIEHTIKLDRNYTGLQTLGAETVVDVWLYSTPDMLKYAYLGDDTNTLTSSTEETPTNTQTDEPTLVQPKEEPMETQPEPVINESIPNDDSWMDFFSKDITELDVDEMIIKPVKNESKDTDDIENLIEPHNIKKENNDDDTCNNSDMKECDNDFDKSNDIPHEILNQPTSPKKRIMKYIDPTTGKIYYLEMDRNLDLSKVQEIVINNSTAKISPMKPNGMKSVKKKKSGVSLLKPEVKSLLQCLDSTEQVISTNYTHIRNDHCYLGADWVKTVKFKMDDDIKPEKKIVNDITNVRKEEFLYDNLCKALRRLTNVRMAVNYLLNKIPLVDERARNPEFSSRFPFVVETQDKFWKLDFAKRRNIEWSRAKLINRMISQNMPSENVWRTKQILIYARLHGHRPIRPELPTTSTQTDQWSSWTDLENSRKIESNIKELYPKATDICSLTIFDNDKYTKNLSETIELVDSDEEIDIVDCDTKVKVKSEVLPERSDLTVLPVESEEDRLRFLFIERKCAEIGIELRNEDVGNGYSYSAVHAVLLSALRSFAGDLVRAALAARHGAERPPHAVWTGWSSSKAVISLEHVYTAAGGPSGILRDGGGSSEVLEKRENSESSQGDSVGRLTALSSRCLGVEQKQTYAL